MQKSFIEEQKASSHIGRYVSPLLPLAPFRREVEMIFFEAVADVAL
jgi:hypothetical protein